METWGYRREEERGGRAGNGENVQHHKNNFKKLGETSNNFRKVSGYKNQLTKISSLSIHQET